MTIAERGGYAGTVGATPARPLRLLVYSTVDRSGPGGVQVVLDGLLESLRDRGHHVVDGRAEACPSLDVDRWSCPLHVRESATRQIHLPSLVRAAAGLARIRPDVVNIHFMTAGAVYFFMLRRLFGYRIVVSLHGSDMLRPVDADAPWLARLLPRADAISVVSAPIRERAMEVPGVDPARVVHIPNGIDTTFWTPGPSDARPGLVAVGRLEPVKGFDVLLEAMALLKARRADLVAASPLSIVGDGACAADLAALIDRLGLAGYVRLEGAEDAEGIRRRLRTAAAFVLPSREEGMPLALLEAMACAAPSVATRVGAVPSVLGSAGLVVEPGDVPGLAEAIEKLLDDRSASTRMRLAARGRAERHSRAVSDQSYAMLFERVATA